MSTIAQSMGAGAPEGNESGARGSRLELWLGSWVRRQILVWLVVLLLTTLSTSLWAEAMESLGRSIDWWTLFGRRLVDGALWGALFEPVLHLGRALGRWVRPRVLLVVCHVPLALGAALGVNALDRAATEVLFGSWDRRWPQPEVADSRPTPRLPGTGDGAARFHDRRPSWDRFHPGRVDRGILFYFAILGIGWGFDTFLRNRQQERRSVHLELRTTRLQKELVDAQLTNLRHQLHPHFLFNSLHSVGGLIRESRDEVALNTLSDLGSLLRAALETSGSQEVALGDELDLVERYLEIERLRLGERLSVTIRSEPGVGQTLVPSLLLLPLVENAIKYGIAPRAEGGRLEVSVWREAERVFIEVLDDGPGFPRDVLRQGVTPSERVSIGIENTRRRLHALYGERSEFVISNPEAGGARALVVVPARSRREGEEA